MKEIVNLNIAEYKKYIPPGLYTLLKKHKKITVADLLNYLDTYLSKEEKNIFFKVFLKKENIDLSKINFSNKKIDLFKTAENYEEKDDKNEFLISIKNFDKRLEESKRNDYNKRKEKENDPSLKKDKNKEKRKQLINEKNFFEKST
jgi:hypothetical protein